MYFWLSFLCVIFLDSTYKWKHTVCVFICLTYFTKYNYNAIHVCPCCCIWQNSILFHSSAVFHCVWIHPHTNIYICDIYTYVCISPFLHPFISWWSLRLLPYLTVINRAAMSNRVHVSFWVRFFISSDICPGVKLLDHMVILFLVSKEPLYCFPLSCTTLHSYQ